MKPRRELLSYAMIFIALSAMYTPANAQNSLKNSLLPWTADLRRAAMLAQLRGEPLVLMISLPGCPWCELLRRNYLMPLRSEGVAAYEIMVNERSRTLLDFKAQLITPAALSKSLLIHITPTVLLFNTEGQEIAQRIEGVASADLIGAILDERLATSREIIKTAPSVAR